MIKSGRKNGFKWKQREEFTEERIDDLDIWDDHEYRVSCKGLDTIEDDSHAEERCICVVW